MGDEAAVGSGMSSASPFGTGIEIVEAGKRGGEDDEARGDTAPSAIGAGAVGMESLGLGSANDSL